MKFLITNDDGFDAPGLAALYQALQPFGEVTVVAPATCHSSKGHAVDTKQPIRVTRKLVEPFGQIYVVHSSPADCIRVGLKHVLQDAPDFVVAGINPGANLGVDLYYSGTAAAAREAALLGVPAFAVSRYLMGDRPIDWPKLRQQVSRLMGTMLAREFHPPGGHFWNINFPAIPGDVYPDRVTIVPHGTEPHAVKFSVLETGEDSELLGYTAAYRERGKSGNCDVSHLFDEHITATLIGPQTTVLGEFRPHSQVSLASLPLPN